MTNYKEIIRLHGLGLNKTRIAESCGCARSTVITALHKAEENDLSWNAVKNLSSEEVTRKLYPATSMGQQYTIQYAGLRVGPQGNAEERRHAQPAVGGVLRTVPPKR